MIKFKEQLAAKNHFDALKYIESLVDTHTEIDENILLHVHWLLMHDIRDDAGQFRTSNVVVGGAFFTPPGSSEVKPMTLKLLEWLKTFFPKVEPIFLASLFHIRFVKIHPFTDGNGRVVRLLMNYILMRNGYPFIADIKVADEKKYLDTLQMSDLGNNEPFINYIAKVVDQTIDANIRGTEKTETLSMAEASNLCSYSQEYLSLLARKGSIGAFKHGRNWYITKENLDRYVESIEEMRERARLRRQKDRSIFCDPKT